MIDTNWQQRPAAHLLMIKPLSFPQRKKKTIRPASTIGFKHLGSKTKNGNIQVTDSDAVLARLDCRFNDRYYSDIST
jgi:hypothetical protein